MFLNTFPFVVFFIVILVFYWKVPLRWQWIVLLVASYFFFGYVRPAYVGIIAATTVIQYFCAVGMEQSARYKKIYLFAAIIFDLGVLFVFKYFNFFQYSIAPLFGNASFQPTVHLLLPIGISFYTFQSISYVVDVYRGTIKSEKHLGYFALFLSFFPQLGAGPIERAQELLPQLKKAHTCMYSDVVAGLELFTLGLFKKMVIADNLGIVVDRVFGNLPHYKGLSLVLTVLLFSWQIYMDFSGYTDMARGIAKILGIELVANFNLPYMASSVRDFWRRWHMSLSRWFRDYLYIPLGGSRKGIVRACVNTLIVFTICGLWHGAAWTFVVWGMFHGVIMALERLGEMFFGNTISVPIGIKRLYAFFVICASWVFFRANTLNDSWYIFRYSFVGLKNFINPSYIWASINQIFVTNSVEMIIAAILIIVAVALEYSSKTKITNWLHRLPAPARVGIYALVVLVIVQLRNADIRPFIYTRF